VILCCGAIDTPKLLLLSGIGPAAHLQELGIPLQAERPGVGENLLDHPEGIVLYQATLPVPATTTQAWEAGLFACVESANGEPDVMVHFGTVVADIYTKQYGFPTATNGFSLTPNVMRARSVGQLRLRTAEPTAAPRLDFRYFCDPEGYDERLVVAGIQLVRRLVDQPALRPWVERELAPGQAIQSIADLSAYARRTSNSVQHPAGTCKMGSPNDPLAVVDPQLRVLGVQALRIADASVFPTLPSVNPNLTCMMIGERCADLVLAGASSQ
jgi:choline oxidase